MPEKYCLEVNQRFFEIFLTRQLHTMPKGFSSERKICITSVESCCKGSNFEFTIYWGKQRIGKIFFLTRLNNVIKAVIVKLRKSYL